MADEPRPSPEIAHDNKALSLIPAPLLAPGAGPAQDADLKADLAGAYSLNTLRAYRADWADFVAWCQRHRKRPIPAEPRDVRDYLCDLAEGKKVSTLRRRLAALARAHRLAGHALDLADPIIRNALRRLTREKGGAMEGRAELLTADLERMLKTTPPGLRGLRDRAILLLGFAAGLRRSEIVALELSDLDWRRDGLVIHVRRSKGDQGAEGQEVGVLYGRRQATCPARAVKRWLAEAGHQSGSVFRAIGGKAAVGAAGLSGQVVWRLVKRYGAAAGLDPKKLGAHSLRVGHVTQARANGADLGLVQRQLRHRRIETTQGYDRGRALRDSTSGKLGL